ncbi:hypothetical protein BJF83_24680 [Nocardiopsis sp. CNR-923]|uniref:hypothetical protein n=1 Tax=Nocardiopsis sp. CNR-923 TaxID=1904965 RepID=UPI00095D1EF5|nr:hypothetical protein [Nocardiopsis sp. CNR-923]OLT30539.1 hypothetical protein BJF83_24680 [Nocardiopsis sp. CNR-923]
MEPLRLSPYLEQAAAALAPGPDTLVALARGRRGFAAAGLVSALLEAEAVPARDAFTVGDRLCRTALAALDPLLSKDLINAHGEGTRKRDIDVLIPVAHTELALASPEGVDRIADSMITLAAALEELFTHLGESTAAGTGQGRAMGVCRAAATELWAAYGGDSGSW